VGVGIRFILDKSKNNRWFNLLAPNCTKCGQPMSFDQEEKLWYCFRDNLFFLDGKAASKPSNLRKRNWGRMLLAALLCMIPSSNPFFFLSAYDKSRLTELNCPRCKRPATELADKTLRWKNKRFDTILEYRCQGCGAVWQRLEQRQ